MKNYNVIILGAGNISAFYDTPQSDNIFTYAHAFSFHKGFNISTIIDIDIEKAQKAAEIWGIKSHYDDFEKAIEYVPCDVVVIAIPDIFHYEYFIKASDFNKFIVLEKPIAINLNQSKEILEISKSKNLKTLVNYTRRFIPEIKKIKNRIQADEFGKLLCGTGYYGKGFIHNGSHLIDLLIYFFGEIKDWHIINTISDYNNDDSISAVLSISNEAYINIHAIDLNHFSIFELDLIFEKGRIKFTDSSFHIEEYKINTDGNFSSNSKLLQTNKYKSSMDKYMYYIVNEIYNNLENNHIVSCDINDGYNTIETCLKIRG